MIQTHRDLGSGGVPTQRCYDLFWEETLKLNAAHFRSDSWFTTVLPIPQHVTEQGWTEIASHWGEEDWANTYTKDGLALVLSYGSKLGVRIAGRDYDAVAETMDFLHGLYLKLDPGPEQIIAKFWYQTPHGPANLSRILDAPSWEAIRDNYPGRATATLDKLFDPAWRPGAGGQLILLRGVPGTGKTYVLRAAARAWHPWANVQYITDPDQFFGNAAYMLQVMLQDSDNSPLVASFTKTAPKWNIIILEDCGELLSKDAHAVSGQALSRLLNLADGFVGQGMRTLLLLTTNEELGALNAAVIRPGRCEANLEFGPFDLNAAQKWMNAHGTLLDPRLGSTLAELYARFAATAPRQSSKSASRRKGEARCRRVFISELQ